MTNGDKRLVLTCYITFVCANRCLETTIDYCGIANPGDNLKSGLPIKAVFQFRYIISFVYLKKVSNYSEINIISLVKRIFYLFIYLPDLITRAEAVTPVSA